MKKLSTIIIILITIIISMIIYLHVTDEKKQTQIKISDTKIELTEKVKITFLDIGQGDATFIEFPNGEQMLVDCAIDARIIEALGRVMSFYDKSIDYLLVTHPDLDHYGGCTDVLQRFDVGNVVYTGLQKDYNEQWQAFWQAIQAEKSTYFEIDSEDVWEIASTTIHFLYPDHSIGQDSHIPGLAKEANANNTSIVFKLSYGDMDVLLTGDAEEELEAYLIETYQDQLGVEVLKASHHGSGGSSIVDFVNLVSPDHTVISAGLDNQYHHPSRRVLKRLERAKSQVWRTDTQGDIELTISRDRVDIKTAQSVDK